MRIQLLGVHNAESVEERLSGAVVDGVLALDAGSLTRSLTHGEQARVRHVLLTHRHYDHIRDVPALAFGTRDAGTLHVYGLEETLDALTSHLLNDVIYSAYHERTDDDGAPRVALHPLNEARWDQEIAGYSVHPVPVFHTCPALGYLVRKEGRSLFYTGDTGPGFASALVGSIGASALPDLLLSETTFANAAYEGAARAGHLTPETLRSEIASLVEGAGWTPRAVVVHMYPDQQAAIEHEAQQIRGETGWDVVIGRAGMTLEV